LTLTANSFARACFVLFGVYLVVSYLLSLGGAFSEGPLAFATADTTTESIFTTLGFTLAAAAVAGFLFNLVPGLLLIWKGQGWADRLVPPTKESSTSLEFKTLLSVGLVLLGVYYLVAGVSGAIGGAMLVSITDEFGRENAWTRLASSVAMLVAGGIVAIVGRRAG